MTQKQHRGQAAIHGFKSQLVPFHWDGTTEVFHVHAIMSHTHCTPGFEVFARQFADLASAQHQQRGEA
ncbi:MAG TPA: hypothetical protein VFV38_21825 [Ktedonobacteraceae bacterium]|nr:hypothetical protein [Ktedonobacteraceae bacterium]